MQFFLGLPCSALVHRCVQNPVNIQQPMIQETVNYFLGKRSNPCPVEDGVLVIDIMEAFTKDNL